jgi:spore germination cell wall hydrolase CwlJ-like protein
MDRNIKTYALTLYGEARGETALVGIMGLQAVGLVILNRYHKGGFGTTLEDVCLKPYQFSCWNKDDPNYPLLQTFETLQSNTFETCTRIAQDLLRWKIPDFTRGATHYHAKNVQPAWTKSMTMTLLLGNHHFYT